MSDKKILHFPHVQIKPPVEYPMTTKFKPEINFFRAGFMFTLGAALATPIVFFLFTALISAMFNPGGSARPNFNPSIQPPANLQDYPGAY